MPPLIQAWGRPPRLHNSAFRVNRRLRRTHCSVVSCSLNGAEAPCAAVDLINWPDGAKPKRGLLTLASLTKLKVDTLRAELGRHQCDTGGTKDQLAQRLLQHVQLKAAGGGTQAAASPQTGSAEPNTASPSTSSSAAAARRKAATPQRAAAQAELDATSGAVVPAPQRRSRSQVSAPAVAAAENLASTSSSGVGTSTASSCSGGGGGSTPGSSWTAQSLTAGSRTSAQASTQLFCEAAGSSDTSGQPPQPSAEEQRQPPGSQRSGRYGNRYGASAGAPGDGEADAALAALGLTASQLPPFQAPARGNTFLAQSLPLLQEELSTMLSHNRGGLLLTVLGSGGQLVGSRRANPCIALQRNKDAWLFDAGEDSQRALMSLYHLKPSKVFRIFITTRSPERLLGLPGLLCSIGTSRERGHAVADIPVHLFGFQGLAEYLSTVFMVSHTYVEMPIVVHEFVPGPVPVEDQEPELFNARAKVWRALVPPDQLSAHGYCDGDLAAFMPTQGRARRGKGLRSGGGVLTFDERAGYLPLSLPAPGDAGAAPLLAPGDMRWTIRIDVEHKVTAALADEQAPSFVFLVAEADRVGNLSVERCTALGITPGSAYARLKAGEAVPSNLGGHLVPPSLVVSPPKPGRTIALLPPAADPSTLARMACPVDVVVVDVSAHQQQQHRQRQHQQQGQQQQGERNGASAPDAAAVAAAVADIAAYVVGVAAPWRPACVAIRGLGPLFDPPSTAKAGSAEGGAQAAAAGLDDVGGGPVTLTRSQEAAALEAVVATAMAAALLGRSGNGGGGGGGGGGWQGGVVLALEDGTDVVVNRHNGPEAPPPLDLGRLVAECEIAELVVLHSQLPQLKEAAQQLRRQRLPAQQDRRGLGVGS